MKISIITVCLNSEQTIEQTIRSVVEQNYQDYEYIIIDGGSTDRTLKIIDKYKESISIVVSEPDDGIYDAMNKGIMMATGDIIGIINSDDWYEPGALKTIGECFEKSDIEVAYGSLNLFKENGKKETQMPEDIKKLWFEMAIPHPTVFVKRNIYIKYGKFEQKYRIAADYELMLRLYINGVRFSCLDRPLANFRCGGISEMQGMKAVEETLQIALNYLSYAPLTMRSYVRDIIISRRRALVFDKILEEFSDCFLDILIKKSGVTYGDNIAVFGAGKWGMRVYEILSRENRRPLFLVDNDEKKWKQKDGGREVMPPEILRKYRGVLLVMIREGGETVLQQVKRMGNKEIYSVTWENIVDSIMSNIRF